MFLADLRTLLTAMKILQWLEKTLRMIWRHQTWQTSFKCLRGLQGFSGFCKFMKRAKLSKSVFFLSFRPDKFCHRVQKYISERKPHHYEPDHEIFLSSQRLLTPADKSYSDKSSLAKWHEHTCDKAVRFHFARFDFTKSTHFFSPCHRFTSLRKGILWREIPFSVSFTFEHP